MLSNDETMVQDGLRGSRQGIIVLAAALQDRRSSRMKAIPSEMTVIEIVRPGGPEMLVEARRQVPKPAEGEVLIKVAAAGVNGPDIVQRKGHLPPAAGRFRSSRPGSRR